MPRNKICFLEPQELNEEVFIYVPPPKQTGDRPALAQAKIAISTNLLHLSTLKGEHRVGLVLLLEYQKAKSLKFEIV